MGLFSSDARLAWVGVAGQVLGEGASWTGGKTVPVGTAVSVFPGLATGTKTATRQGVITNREPDSRLAGILLLPRLYGGNGGPAQGLTRLH